MRSLIGMYATTRRKSFLTKKNTDQKKRWWTNMNIWIYSDSREHKVLNIQKQDTPFGSEQMRMMPALLTALSIWCLHLAAAAGSQFAFACSHSLGVYTARFMKQTLAKVKIRCNFWKHVDGEKLLFGLSADWYFKVHSYAWISSLD